MGVGGWGGGGGVSRALTDRFFNHADKGLLKEFEYTQKKQRNKELNLVNQVLNFAWVFHKI